MPRINLLPWREQQRTERKKAFGVGLAAAGIAAVAMAGVGYLLFNQMIEGQQARNAKLRQEITVLDKQIEEINSLELQKKQFIDRMQIIEQLQQSRPEIVHIFDTFTKTIPDGAYLTAITQSDQNFVIQGVAQSPSLVSSLYQSLEASEWLHEVGIVNIEAAKGGTVGNDFWVDMKQRVSAATVDPAAGKGTDKRKKP